MRFIMYCSISLCSVLPPGAKLFNIDSGRDAGLHSAPTQHFTAIFTTFAMMTLFNVLNARKIHDQRNIFEGFTRNTIFIWIWLGTFVAQVSVETIWHGLSECSNVCLSGCSNVCLSGCSNVCLSGCSNVCLSGCSNVCLSGCSNQIILCKINKNIKITRCTSAIVEAIFSIQ